MFPANAGILLKFLLNIANFDIIPLDKIFNKMFNVP